VRVAAVDAEREVASHAEAVSAPPLTEVGLFSDPDTSSVPTDPNTYGALSRVFLKK
jgi:hypothetical protein